MKNLRLLITCCCLGLNALFAQTNPKTNPTPKQTNPNGKQTNPNGKQTNPTKTTKVTAKLDGKCTTGDCLNGKGRFVFTSGDKYIGEFKAGLMDGRGAYTDVKGNIYKGQFKKGNRHGYGTMQWKGGDMYIGEYANNDREGEGTYYFLNGGVKHGLFKKGELVEDWTNKTDPAIAANTGQKDPLSTVSTMHPSTTTQGSNNNNINNNPNGLASRGVPKIVNKFSAVDGQVSGEKRLALVIGNAKYEKNPLTNPANDAKGMKEQLQKLGFDVWLYEDATKKQMKQVIREFGESLKNDKGVGLFFYAGHGVQAEGRNYLLPVDADITKSEDIEFEGFDLARVLVEMEYAENKMNIVILDACRDNPFKKEFGEKSKENAGFTLIKTAPVNSIVAFSTAPGAVASDGGGNNGLYTQELLKTVSESGLKLEDVFKRVRSNVRKASDGKQIPWENSAIEADFYFKK